MKMVMHVHVPEFLSLSMVHAIVSASSHPSCLEVVDVHVLVLAFASLLLEGDHDDDHDHDQAEVSDTWSSKRG